MEEKLTRAEEEVSYQKGLNANLLRISRERANADRSLRPKKEHTGYAVVRSMELGKGNALGNCDTESLFNGVYRGAGQEADQERTTSG